MSKNALMKKKHSGQITGTDTIVINIIGYILIGFFALICVIPFYLIIVASFTSEATLIRSGYPIFPVEFDVQSYALCLKNPISIMKAYGTTIGVTAIGTFCAVMMASMTGYVLSRQDFPWRNKFSFFFFFTTLFQWRPCSLVYHLRQISEYEKLIPGIDVAAYVFCLEHDHSQDIHVRNPAGHNGIGQDRRC